MNRGTWTIVGFLFFVIGFSALILTLVGVNLSFLSWLDNFGQLASFMAKILMIMIGAVIVFLVRTDWRLDEDL